jgi:SAM-dependent methyltransferase
MTDISYDYRAYWRRLHRDIPGKLGAVGYPGLGNGFNEVGYRVRLRAAERILREHRGAPIGHVLEAAVGVGAYARLWNRLGVRSWTGVDISDTAVEALRTRYPSSRFLAADISGAQFAAAEIGPPGGFDLVTAIDVLYHLVDGATFESALRNLAQRVRPGGGLLISDVFCPVERQIAAHVVRRPLSRYLDTLAPVGFRLAGRRAVFAVLGDPVVPPEPLPRHRAMWNIWRVAQKAVRTAPAFSRSVFGGGVALALWPLDSAFRTLEWARGTNLELALFVSDIRAQGGAGEGGRSL